MYRVRILAVLECYGNRILKKLPGLQCGWAGQLADSSVSNMARGERGCPSWPVSPLPKHARPSRSLGRTQTWRAARARVVGVRTWQCRHGFSFLALYGPTMPRSTVGAWDGSAWTLADQTTAVFAPGSGWHYGTVCLMGGFILFTQHVGGPSRLRSCLDSMLVVYGRN